MRLLDVDDQEVHVVSKLSDDLVESREFRDERWSRAAAET